MKGSPPTGHAVGVIVRGSSLLTQANADRLAVYRGLGDVTLTRIFSHTAGDGKTASHFHAAADGAGPTFTVLRVTHVDGVLSDQVVVGYNPHGWGSGNDVILTDDPARRVAAFLVNLTSGALQRQRTDGESFSSRLTAVNSSLNGPVFGDSDVNVLGDLDRANFAQVSYGGSPAGVSILGGPAGAHSALLGTLEVFAVATTRFAAARAGVAMLAGIGYLRRRKGGKAPA